MIQKILFFLSLVSCSWAIAVPDPNEFKIFSAVPDRTTSKLPPDYPTECPVVANGMNCEISNVTIYLISLFSILLFTNPLNNTLFQNVTTTTCSAIGTYDEDCKLANENGEEEEERFGLCCFNGCKNECLKKTCNIVETTENETTFEEKCTDGFRQECHDETVSKCEMVVVTDVDGDNKKVETVLECKNVTETIDVTKTECYEDLRQECKPVAVSKCQKGTDKITIGKYISPPSSCNLYSLFSEMRN